MVGSQVYTPDSFYSAEIGFMYATNFSLRVFKKNNIHVTEQGLLKKKNKKEKKPLILYRKK